MCKYLVSRLEPSWLNCHLSCKYLHTFSDFYPSQSQSVFDSLLYFDLTGQLDEIISEGALFFKRNFYITRFFFSFRVCTVWIKETIKENQRATLYSKTQIVLILLACFDKQSTILIQNWPFSHFNVLACMLQFTENQLFAHENTKKIKSRIISKISACCRACPKGCFPIKILLEYN